MVSVHCYTKNFLFKDEINNFNITFSLVIYNLFNTLLDSVCWYFVDEFLSVFILVYNFLFLWCLCLALISE